MVRIEGLGNDPIPRRMSLDREIRFRPDGVSYGEWIYTFADRGGGSLARR